MGTQSFFSQAGGRVQAIRPGGTRRGRDEGGEQSSPSQNGAGRSQAEQEPNSKRMKPEFSTVHHDEEEAEDKEEYREIYKEHEDSGGASASTDGVKCGVCGTDEPEEEADIPKTRRVPVGPTKEEKETHEATHSPYREWCKHCLRGRGRNRPNFRCTHEKGKYRRWPG